MSRAVKSPGQEWSKWYELVYLSFWKSRELAGDGSFWFITAKALAINSVKKYCWERATISVTADLQWLKARHHKYHLKDCTFNKCDHILCFRMVNVQKHSFMTHRCGAETMNQWGVILKRLKGVLPSASHTDRSSMLTSICLASLFKVGHFAWLQLFFRNQATYQCCLQYVYFPYFLQQCNGYGW